MTRTGSNDEDEGEITVQGNVRNSADDPKAMSRGELSVENSRASVFATLS